MEQQPVPSLYIKYLRTFSHPLLLIIAFLLLPVGFGPKGFFLVIIANSLSTGSSFALAAIGGIVLFLLAWILHGRKYNTLLDILLSFGAIFIMMCSFTLYVYDHQMELSGPISVVEILLFFNFVVLLYCFHFYAVHVFEKNGDHS
jgi:hypothetical protein